MEATVCNKMMILTHTLKSGVIGRRMLIKQPIFRKNTQQKEAKFEPTRDHHMGVAAN